MTLNALVIAFESEDAARLRLAAFGYPPDVAAEIAVYLAQSTDLPLFIDDITQALSREGIAAEFVALDGLPQRLRDLAPQQRPDDRMGVHRWRALLSRLVGSRSRPPRGLRAVRQPRRGGASVPGQIREPRTRFRRRPGRAAIKADGRRSGNRRARGLGRQFRTVVRQAEYAWGEDRHFRRQPLPRSSRSERSGETHLGALP